MKLKTLLFALSTLLSCQIMASVQLDLYTWRQQEKPLWEKINQQNLLPGITVKVQVINFDTYQSHMQLALLDERPDLFQWMPGEAALTPLISQGYISENTFELDSINPGALAAAAVNNRYFGVPFAVQLQGLLINKKLMRKHGLNQQPQSLSQLESYFSQLKSKGITPLHIASDDWYLSQVVAEVLTAGLIKSDFAKQLISGEKCFTDQEFVNLLAQLSHWQNNGFINKNATQEDYQGSATNIALGNSAMVMDGGWRTSPNSPFIKIDHSFEFDFWPIPGGSNKFIAFADGTYQINAKGKHAQHANEVLAFTKTKTFAKLFANTLNELPAYKYPVSLQSKNLQMLADKLAQHSYSESLFTSASLNAQAPNYQSLVREAIKQVLSGKAPSVAAKHIQEGLNSWHYIGSKQCQ